MTLLTVMFFVAVFVVAVIVVALRFRERVGRERGGGVCPGCGYSRHGLDTAACPECGTRWEQAAKRFESSQAGLWFFLAVIFLPPIIGLLVILLAL